MEKNKQKIDPKKLPKPQFTLVINKDSISKSQKKRRKRMLVCKVEGRKRQTDHCRSVGGRLVGSKQTLT